MKIFAIADLHLPAKTKPMDMFGAHWERHFEKISQDWCEHVAADDVVMLPGDLSWAMTLTEAMEDIMAIGALPGRKLILRGNHDYWWSSIGRVRDALPDGMIAIQNDAIKLDGVLFAGSRGWTCLSKEAADEKIRAREQMRLEMSLKAARALDAEAPLYVMTHFPPVFPDSLDTPEGELMTRYGAKCVCYGHLHGASVKNGFEGELQGVQYHLVSCDALRFALKQVGAEE